MKTLATFLFTFLLSLPALSASEIRNGDFAKGLQGWVVQRLGQTSLSASDAAKYCQFEDGTAFIDVSAIDNEKDKPAGVILTQYIKEPAEGTRYRISFETKLPAGQTMTYGLGAGIPTGPHKGNLGGGIHLTPVTGEDDWVETEAEFVWNPAEVLSQVEGGELGPVTLQFRIGTTSEFQIRNVTLTPQP